MQAPSKLTESAGNGQGVAKPTEPEAEGSTSRLSQEFQDFVTDVEDLITGTTSITSEDLVRVKAKLGERVAAVKESIEEMSGAVVQRVRKTATVTNSYVHEQPWAAVGIGAALGVLLGFVLGRRK